MLHNCVFHVGVEIHPPDADQPFVITVHTICASCDLPAKAMVQNFIQFNGIYGCGYCEQPGEVVSTERGGNITTFPFNQLDPKGPHRTQEKCMEDAKEACLHHNVVC